MRIDQFDPRELGLEFYRLAQVVLGPAVMSECELVSAHHYIKVFTYSPQD